MTRISRLQFPDKPPAQRSFFPAKTLDLTLPGVYCPPRSGTLDFESSDAAAVQCEARPIGSMRRCSAATSSSRRRARRSARHAAGFHHESSRDQPAAALGRRFGYGVRGFDGCAKIDSTVYDNCECGAPGRRPWPSRGVARSTQGFTHTTRHQMLGHSSSDLARQTR